MALPASGPISMNMVNTELGISATAAITLNDAAVRTLFDKSSGAISLSDGYGKSAGPTVATYTTAGSTFTVPSGVSVVNVKLYGAGGRNYGPGGGSGAYISGSFAVSSNDVLHFYNTGDNTSVASSVTWKRAGVVQGYAIAGAGGGGGGDGDDGGDNWNDRYGGTGGVAGLLGGTAANGSSAAANYSEFGYGGSQSAVGAGGSGANQNGGSGTAGGSGGAGAGGNGGNESSGTNANGGSGGPGGGGYYGGGGGGGGNGRNDYPDSGDGGGGGGGGSSFQSNMTGASSGYCDGYSDGYRGTAGNPGELGKVVIIY